MADGLRYRIAAGSCALLALTWPASAAEGPPKTRGTLTYLIPADSPRSFDGIAKALLRWCMRRRHFTAR